MMVRRQCIPARAGLVPLLCALALLSSAGPSAAAEPVAVSDTILATYDGGVVTPTEFGKVWSGLAPSEYPPGDPLTSRQAFLGSIVDRKLLAREATRRPVVLTPAETAEIDRQRDLMIQNGLFTEMTRGLAEPTAEDLDALHRQMSMLAEVRLVRFNNWDRARSWRSRLTSGTPGSALDDAIRREGAALAEADSFRFLGAEQFPDTLADAIWRLRPGQVSEIHEFGGKPTLVQLRRFGPRPVRQLMEAENLPAEYQRRRYNQIREEFRVQAVAEVGRTFDEEAMALLLRAHLNVPRRDDVDSTNGLPTFRTSLPLPTIAPSDTGRVLVRAGGHAFTIGDYLAFWGKVPPLARPEVRDRQTLEGVVDRVALAPQITRLGREHGVDRDPRLLERLDRMREGFALDHYYNDEIQAKVKVDESGLRKLFAASPGHYDDRASITSHIILVDRRSLADSLLARLKDGASFSNLAREYSMDGESSAKGGDMGTQYRGSQTNVGLEDAMYATPAGQVGGPEHTPQGWVLWRIDGKTPGLKRSFADARPMLERDFKILEADRLLQLRLEQLRKEAHVKLYPERVTPRLGAEGPWGE
jgi:hypothetical protein